MSPRLALLPLLVASLAVAGEAENAPELSATTPADYVEHAAGDSGVTLRAPKDWTEGPKPSPNLKLMLLAGGGNSVNLVVVTAGPGETIETILKVVPDALGHQFEEYEPIKSDFVKLGGQPTVRITYRAVARKGQPKLQFCQFFINKNGKDYVLTFTAFPDQYAGLLKTAEQVAASIKVP